MSKGIHYPSLDIHNTFTLYYNSSLSAAVCWGYSWF